MSCAVNTNRHVEQPLDTPWIYSVNIASHQIDIDATIQSANWTASDAAILTITSETTSDGETKALIEKIAIGEATIEVELIYDNGEEDVATFIVMDA